MAESTDTAYGATTILIVPLSESLRQSGVYLGAIPLPTSLSELIPRSLTDRVAAGVSISLDFRTSRGENPLKSPQMRLGFGSIRMYQPPPLRGLSVFDDKKVLLIDSHQPARDARARVLRSHGIKVHVAEDLSRARFLWRPHIYNLILLDVRGHLPGDALEFYVEIKHASPEERFVFLVGPPAYLSRTWPTEAMAAEKEAQQWAETVKRFLNAA